MTGFSVDAVEFPLPEAAIAAALARIRWNDAGLVPAIAQDARSGTVLMMAWMNAEAVRASLTEGRGIYWSRSRASLWRKGESSGHVQTLREMRIDCDGDTLLLLVDQKGPACHTNRPDCFFDAVRADGIVTLTDPAGA